MGRWRQSHDRSKCCTCCKRNLEGHARMDLKVGRWSIVVLAATGMACCAARTPRAETPAGFCAKAGTDDTLRPIPAALVPAVNALFHTAMPPDVAMRMT